MGENAHMHRGNMQILPPKDRRLRSDLVTFWLQLYQLSHHAKAICRVLFWSADFKWRNIPSDISISWCAESANICQKSGINRKIMNLWISHTIELLLPLLCVQLYTFMYELWSSQFNITPRSEIHRKDDVHICHLSGTGTIKATLYHFKLKPQRYKRYK